MPQYAMTRFCICADIHPAISVGTPSLPPSLPPRGAAAECNKNLVGGVAVCDGASNPKVIMRGELGDGGTTGD